MRKILPLIITMVCVLNGCREPLHQEQRFFGSHDLRAGKYKLLAWGMEGEWIEDYDRFYIDDVEVLESMQSRWVFKHKVDPMPCGYGYTLMFVNEDSVLNQNSVNIDCEYMGGWIHFPKSYLEDYKHSFVRMTDEEARRFGAKYSPPK